MRKLTAKQKKILNQEFYLYYPSSVRELEDGVYEKLEAINNTEILHQEVDRYLSDKTMEKMYGN